MSRIFISHSSSDNEAALELRSWLINNGFDQIFLDLDPQRGIQAGDRWQEVLLDSCRRCEAVIFLISRYWLSSSWCVAEYLYTRNFGKRCLPVVIEETAVENIPDFITAEHQLINLATDPSAYDKLKQGIEKAGVAAESFVLPIGRRPYPGLEALTEDDPAIFFGRDAQILEALDELRRMAASGAKRLLILLGASGSGKSSLLRAGLIPRLQRDNVNYLTLPVVRPDRAVLDGRFGLWAALEGAAAVNTIAGTLPEGFVRNRSAIAEKISNGERDISDFLDAFRTAAIQHSINGKLPTTVLAIDQGEELFTSEGRSQAQCFFDLLGQVLQEDKRALIIIAMRSDAYPQLQAVETIPGHLHAPFNLGPMRPAGYKEIIERPAHVTGLKIEPGLTEALLAETEGADALPLLAYTLERLHRLYGADGALKLGEYQAMGGMQGFITTAVEEALCNPPRPLPTDRDVLLELLRRAFIPHLVQSDSSGVFTRRVAQKNELPGDALPLIDLLVERRLLVLNANIVADNSDKTVEIAHEALLRSWPLLVGWLDEERDFLSWRTSIANASGAWKRNERDLLTRKELLIATEWLAGRPGDIRNEDRRYIEASVKAEEGREIRKRKRQQKTVLASLAAFVILLVFLLSALWQWNKAEEAHKNEVRARESAEAQAKLARARELAIRADTMFSTSIGQSTQAAYLAMTSLKLKHTVEAQQVLANIMRLTPRQTRKIDTPWAWSWLQFSPSNSLALNWTHSNGTDFGPSYGDILHLDPDTFETKLSRRLEGYVWPAISPGGKLMAISGYARRLQILDLKTGELLFEQPYKYLITAAFDATGQKLFVARGDGTLETRQAPSWNVVQSQRFETRETPLEGRLSLSLANDGKTGMVATWLGAYIFSDGGSKIKALDIHERAARSVISPTGRRAVTVQWDLPVILWDPITGKQLKTLLENGLHSARAFSSDGSRFASATEHGDIFVWEAETGKLLAQFALDKQVDVLSFSEDGDLLASGDQGGAVHIWDIESEKQKHLWRHDSGIRTLVFAGSNLKLFVGDNANFLIGYDLTTGKESIRERFSRPVFGIGIDRQSGAMVIAVEGSMFSNSWTDMRATNSKTGDLLWKKQQNGGFSKVLFSPDGQNFATTEPDGFVKIWDSATGTLKAESEVEGYSNSLAYSPDGHKLVVQKQEVAVIDAQTGKKLAAFGEPGGVTNAIYHASTDTLYTYGADYRFRAWNVTTGEQKWQRKNPSEYSIQFSGDGSRYLQTHSETWKIFNTENGRLVTELPAMSGYSRSELTKDGQYLVRVSKGRRERLGEYWPYTKLEIWHLDSSRKVTDKRYNDVSSLVRLLPSNRVQVLSRGKEQMMEVLDAHTGHVLWEIKNSKDYTKGFSRLPKRPQDPLLVQGTNFTEFRDQLSGKVLARLNRAVWGKIIPNRPSQMLAINTRESGSSEKGYSTALINWKTGEEIWRVRLLENGKGSIKDLHFSPDGRRVLLHIGDHTYQLMILDLKDGRVLGTLNTDSPWREMWPLPDPDLVLAKDFSDTVRIWRISKKTEIFRFSHTYTADGFAVTKNSNRVVTYTKGTIRVWHLDTLRQMTMRHTLGSISEIAIRPDGKQLAYLTDRAQESTSGAEFQRLVLWNLEKDTITVIPVDPYSGNLIYDSSGKRFAYRMGKSNMRVLDVNSLKPVLQIQALRDGELKKAQFSIDGMHLLIYESNSYSGKHASGYRVWDIFSKQEIARLDGVQMVERPSTTEIALRNQMGWQAWDILSGEFSKTPLPELYRGITASFDGRALAGFNDQKFWMMDVATTKTMMFEPEQKNEKIIAYALSDLNEFAVLSQRKFDHNPGTISLRSLPDGQEQATETPDAVVTSVKVANKNTSVILLGTPGTWAVFGSGTSLFFWQWQVNNLRVLSEDQPITEIAVSPDGSIFVTAEGKIEEQSSGRPKQLGKLQLRVWDAQTGRILRTKPLDEPVEDLTFTPDGNHLSTRQSKRIDIFNTNDWSVVKSFDREVGFVATKMRFITNNLAIVPEQKRIRIWHLKDDSSFVIPVDSDFPVTKVSKDGSALAITDDNLLRVWDIDNRTELLRRRFEKRLSIAFAGENDRLFAYQTDIGLVEIPWRTQDMIDEACRRLPDVNPDEFKKLPNIRTPDAEPLCSL